MTGGLVDKGETLGKKHFKDEYPSDKDKNDGVGGGVDTKKRKDSVESKRIFCLRKKRSK